MTRFCLLLLPVVTALSCYSAGGDGDGDEENGGAAGVGARGGSGAGAGTVSGGSSNGGSAARGGSGGDTCGPCPGAACQQAVQLVLTPDPAVAPANLSLVQIEGAGLTFECFGYSDCSVQCTSLEYQLADGSYALNVTAPGFEPALVQFDVINPTNCGCCGCCPASQYQQLTLVADGSALETCCADLSSDAANCGACGVPCAAGSCVDGFCSR